jgi:hypothetical protein
MKMIYQIGRVPLYGSLVNDIELSEERSWIVKRTQFQQTGGYFDHTPYGRRLFDDTDVSASGSITSKGNPQFLHLMSRIKALGGERDVPIIVFELQDIGGDPSIRWLITYGNVVSVEDTSAYGAENDEGFYWKDFSIKMKIQPEWRPLLRWYWEDRPAQAFTGLPTAQNGIDTLFEQPQRYSEISEFNYFQQWDDALSELATEMWPYLYQRGLGYGSDYAAFKTFYINSVEHVWAAPPTAFYAFTDLLPQGSISITVESASIIQTSSLDLEALDGQLTDRGLSGLFASDEIFVGNTDPFCSFILRSGQIITSFVPEWTYDSIYPGELTVGLNKIAVAGDNTTGKFAANIKFGAL